jgi:hypothetical protein
MEAYRADLDDAALGLFKEASELDAGDETLADEAFVGFLSFMSGDRDTARDYLERVVNAPGADRPDGLIQKYAPDQWLKYRARCVLHSYRSGGHAGRSVDVGRDLPSRRTKRRCDLAARAHI